MDHAQAITRVDRAEMNAYIALYSAAAEHGCGWLELDGMYVVWSAYDADPGFSCVLNLADAADPGSMLERLEDAAAAQGARMIGVDTPPPLAVWATPEELQRRGYAHDYDELIVAAAIPRDLAAPASADGSRIERVADPALLDVFARTLNVGYEVPAEHPRGYIFGSTIGMPDWRHYLVWIDDRPASASVLFVTDGVADLFVTTTVPEMRGRGAQNALIGARIHDGRAAGCDLATSQVIATNASPRNMARQGFEVLYKRSIWGKPLER